MSRKRREKSNKKAVEKQKLPNAPKTPEIEKAEPEKPFDFGGLPDRDLKKNLGCG